MKFFSEGTWSRVFLFLFMLVYFLLNVTNFQFDGSEKALAFLALFTAIAILFGK